MKNSLLIFSFLLCAQLCTSQTITKSIEGKITRCSDGEGIGNVKITVDGRSRNECMTDGNGQFSMLVDGNQYTVRLTLKRNGYKPNSINIRLDTANRSTQACLEKITSNAPLPPPTKPSQPSALAPIPYRLVTTRVSVNSQNQTLYQELSRVRNKPPKNTLNMPLIQDCILVQGAHQNTQGFRGWTALHECAMQNDVVFARKLLEKGVNYNARNDNDATPILIAAYYHNWDVFFLLFNLTDIDTLTPTKKSHSRPLGVITEPEVRDSIAHILVWKLYAANLPQHQQTTERKKPKNQKTNVPKTNVPPTPPIPTQPQQKVTVPPPPAPPQPKAPVPPPRPDDKIAMIYDAIYTYFSNRSNLKDMPDIFEAAMYDDIPMANIAISTDPNCINKLWVIEPKNIQVDPLILATFYGQKSIVEILLRNRVQLYKINKLYSAYSLSCYIDRKSGFRNSKSELTIMLERYINTNPQIR